ncbi:hypothetical protein [Paenibacillus guangzhouensis]|uniref:hypothetical protein n=1 Tax=Paenibacillus guangzhouensis TaxID=1473112 RepID=UPI0012670A50|nr:hypothetical protein [Paenibacillus guangzhouensis]
MRQKIMALTLSLSMLATFPAAAFAADHTKPGSDKSLKIGQTFMLDGVTVPEHTVLLDQQLIDVNKDGVLDMAYVVGTREDNKSAYSLDINLIVVDGKTAKIMNANIIGFDGYMPYINFAGDFNGDKANDIMLTADTGGSGGYITSRIVSFYNNTPKVILSDNLRVKGNLATFNSLDPIDTNGDGIYELLGEERLTGDSNAETIGYVNTTLAYRNGEFTATNQTKTKEALSTIHTSPAQDFMYVIPASWDGIVHVEKLNQAKLDKMKHGGIYSERILYTPGQTKGAKASDEMVLSITKYTKKEWAAIAKGPNNGVIVGTQNDKVYVIETPQSNPYPSGSKEARIFNDLVSYIPTFNRMFNVTTPTLAKPDKTYSIAKPITAHKTTTSKALGTLMPQIVTIRNEKLDTKGNKWYQIQDAKFGEIWFQVPK